MYDANDVVIAPTHALLWTSWSRKNNNDSSSGETIIRSFVQQQSARTEQLGRTGYLSG